MTTILISIKAEHNANIESGRKTLEMRKRIPRCALPIRVLTYESGKNGRHMVTNEWVCDYIREEHEVADGLVDIILEEESCVKVKDLIEYADGDILYSMHISDLVIYDKPRELSEFIVPSKFGCCNEGKCKDCIFLDRGNGFNIEDDCNAPFCTDEYKPLRKPPRSWMYVEA